MIKLLKQLGVTVAVISAVSVSAVPTLRISDGINPDVVVTDGDLIGPDVDANGAAGAVTWIGTIGVWTINVDTGVTYPALGHVPTSPYMDLTFTSGSTAAGTLTLTFSQDGFTYNGGLIDRWGGTTPGTVLNRVQRNGVDFISQGPLGPGAFSSTAGGIATLAPADTLSLVVIIRHTDAGLTTGNKEVSVPDGGSTLILLGSALFAVGFMRRKLGIKG